VTVAASSFQMEVTDPQPLLDEIDLKRLEELLGKTPEASSSVTYVHPGFELRQAESSQSIEEETTVPTKSVADNKTSTIHGKVQVLGDFIDTDALAPAEALSAKLTAEEMGTYCLKYTHPEFRERVKSGLNVVVAGQAFGVGSSRENAVTALQGAGVQAVIAKSFAFIYGRNQPNLGMLGFVITDDDFHALAKNGAPIEINVERRIVSVSGHEFKFQLSDLEWQLVKTGGMTKAFHRWGKGVLNAVTGQKSPAKTTAGWPEEDTATQSLQW
jgi:3-isopropylmalate dehydratase small subunit